MTSKQYTDVIQFDKKKAASDPSYTSSVLPKSPAFVVYDSSFGDVLGPSPKLTLVEQRADKFAHEAGVYIKSTNKNYFTSNYQTGKSIELYSVDCDSHKVEELSYPHVVNGNGGCNYKDKVLYCAQGDLTTPSALVLVDPKTSSSEILLNNYHGRPFNSINDVVVHHRNDDIWFTDPTYGFEQAFRPPPQLPSQVYRFKPSTGEIWCVADGFIQCNGLCFSRAQKKMYITDTAAMQAHGTPGNGQNFSFNARLPSAIYVYDLIDNGTRLCNRQVFAHCDSGVPDGIKCDDHDNVYSGCGDGIHVWNSQGTLIGKIYVGSVIANFNFVKGGIWAFAEESLFFIELQARGGLAWVEWEGH